MVCIYRAAARINMTLLLGCLCPYLSSMNDLSPRDRLWRERIVVGCLAVVCAVASSVLLCQPALGQAPALGAPAPSSSASSSSDASSSSGQSNNPGAALNQTPFS